MPIDKKKIRMVIKTIIYEGGKSYTSDRYFSNLDNYPISSLLRAALKTQRDGEIACVTINYSKI